MLTKNCDRSLKKNNAAKTVDDCIDEKLRIIVDEKVQSIANEKLKSIADNDAADEKLIEKYCNETVFFDILQLMQY